MYKVTQISKGFWSDAESDSAQQIRNLPKILSYCQTFEKEVITVANCSNSLETTLHAILTGYLEKKLENLFIQSVHLNSLDCVK